MIVISKAPVVCVRVRVHVCMHVHVHVYACMCVHARTHRQESYLHKKAETHKLLKW